MGRQFQTILLDVAHSFSFSSKPKTFCSSMRCNKKLHIMEKIKWPILLATGYLLLYTATAQLEAAIQWTILLFSLSPLPVIWMVWRVLRDGTPSNFTFKERFYEDYHYERVPVKEHPADGRDA